MVTAEIEKCLNCTKPECDDCQAPDTECHHITGKHYMTGEAQQKRVQEINRLADSGMTLMQIAEHLGIKVSLVKYHRVESRRKVQANG